MARTPFASRLIDWAIRWRWPLLITGVVLGALSVLPSRELQFDRSIENMFAPDDPLLVPYRKLVRTFGGNEVVLAAYIDPRLMTPAGMDRLRQLTARLEKVPGVQAVLSLNNGPLGDAIINEDNPLSREFLQLFEGYLVSEDRQTAAAVLMLDPRNKADRTPTIDALRTIVQSHDESGVIVGEPVMVVDGFRYLEQDGALLGWVSTTLLVLTILICFRSVRWVLIPLAVVQLTLLLTKAVLVLSDMRLTLVSSMLTAIVTIIGIATTIHLVVRFREYRERGADPRAALAGAGALLAAPIFWACSTDAAGFGSLLMAKVGPVKDFGIMMVAGSLLVLVGLLLMVPGLALIGSYGTGPKRAWGEGQLDVGLNRLSNTIERWPKLLLIVSVIVAVLALLGCLRLEVETDFTKNFRADSPVVRAYQFVETRLGGAGVWDVIVPAPEVLDWAYLRRVLRLEERLREEVRVETEEGRVVPGLTKVLSVADAVQAATLGRLDNLPFAPLRNQAARLALDRMASDMPTFMGALIGRDPLDENKQFLRIMLRSRERQPSAQKRALIAQVEQISREEFPEAQATGFFVLLTNLVDSMLRDQWVTFGLACVGIALMMLLAFRNVPLALVALVPNALPILMVTGLLGWLGLKINMGAAMIAAVSMGLSVDSSIHYITQFRGLRAEGLDVHRALAGVHQSVGRAMIFSTLALVVGFSALLLSQFVPTIYFGALVGLTMLGGLIGNLVVLPLLLALWPGATRVPATDAASTE